VGLGQRFGLVSKETALLANNVLLLTAAGAVLLGTLYPLFLDALGLGKISVGPPYFDTVFRGLMAPLVVLVGIGPLARWRGDELPSLARRLRVAAVVAVLVPALVAALAGQASPWSALGYALAGWVVASVLIDAAAWRQTWRQLTRAQLGMWLAHLGVAGFIVGVTTVRTYDAEIDVRVHDGEVTELGGYQFRFVGATPVRGPNYVAMQARIEVTRNGQPIALLTPEKRVYRVQRNPMTEAAIDSNLVRDLYVSLGDPLPDGAWTLRVQHKPMVIWIWLGCMIMACGGALAASDRRYRRRADATQAEAFGTSTPGAQP
jgi:cytochrome c-type biogenesis protein CcmF